MTTIEEMAKLKTHSEKWFSAAFETCKASDKCKEAAKKICFAYGIHGQADPAYIANVIDSIINK